MTQPRTLTLIVYAPALAGKDGRALDAIQGMERALPGLRLEWRISESGRPIPLPQRDAWLMESIEGGARTRRSSARVAKPNSKCMQSYHSTNP
ncbi:hypothetical protein MFU01_72460 [Myxococcus fulvus]|uniref:Uncharacterized protein n=1 Tax=Myxococcus fulvus TaxID=33 RepID=A0A511TDG1_MYXFU|nr:hypothetical protein MFU01_72460 [Myxococcus fulvus]